MCANLPRQFTEGTTGGAPATTAARLGPWLRSLALAALTGLLPWAAQAQLNYLPADAQILAGTYTDLGTTGSAITVVDNDDANSAAQPIGFSFQYAGQTFTQFVFNTNGFIKLGSTPPSAAALYYTDVQLFTGPNVFDSTDPADEYLIVPFNYDLAPSATGTVEFRRATTGTAPSRASRALLTRRY